MVARLERSFPKQVLLYVLAVVAVFVYFAPVWAELPLSVSAAYHRLMFPTWR